MPINIQKGKQDQLTKPTVKVKAQTSKVLTVEEESLVDQYVALVQALDSVTVTFDGKQMSLKAATKILEKTKETLASVALDAKRFPLDKEAVLEGSQGFGVKFSEQSHPREVKDKDGLIQALKEKFGGYNGLLPFISIPFKVIDETLTEAEQTKFIGTKPGSRSCKGVEKL